MYIYSFFMLTVLMKYFIKNSRKLFIFTYATYTQNSKLSHAQITIQKQILHILTRQDCLS